MIEIILGIVMCVAMAKIASADDQSGILWGVLSFVILLGCGMVIPWPYVRVLIAGGAAFVAMIGWKMIADR
jgi:hypothetical protein